MILKKTATALEALQTNEIDILLIQVNSSGIIDSNALSTIIEKYSNIFSDYLYFCKMGEMFSNNVLVDIGDNKKICLMFTSYYQGKPNNRYSPDMKNIDSFKTRLSAFKKCVSQIFKTHSHLKIGIYVEDIENKKLESAEHLTNEEYYDIFLLHQIEKKISNNLIILTKKTI